MDGSLKITVEFCFYDYKAKAMSRCLKMIPFRPNEVKTFIQTFTYAQRIADVKERLLHEIGEWFLEQIGAPPKEERRRQTAVLNLLVRSSPEFRMSVSSQSQTLFCKGVNITEALKDPYEEILNQFSNIAEKKLDEVLAKNLPGGLDPANLVFPDITQPPPTIYHKSALPLKEEPMTPSEYDALIEGFKEPSAED